MDLSLYKTGKLNVKNVINLKKISLIESLFEPFIDLINICVMF